MQKVLFVAATEFEAGDLRASGLPVVVTGIGAVNAAHALTAYLSTHDAPSVVIQCGVAGAYVPANVPVGAVVLADTEIYGDTGVLTLEGWQPMEIIGIPLVEAKGDAPARFNYFPLDPMLVTKAAAIAGTRVAQVGAFLTLSIVTGVRVLGDELHERFGAICESMEGAAAAHVCALRGVPFLEVRGISNLVEDRNRDAWKLKEAAAAAQSVALVIAQNL